MRQRLLVWALFLPLLAAAPAAAQAPTGTVAQIFANKVKAGMQQQYEAGRKKHMAWHKAQNDKWEWFTWEIVTGDRTGQYLVGSFDHAWKDFDGRDKFEAADDADAVAAMGPSQESSVMSFYAFRPDMSLPPVGPRPAAFAQVTHFYLKAEGINDFTDGVKKVNEAIKKTKYPANSLWYQLVSGGEGPELVLVAARNGWADFQPPDKTLDSMVEEAWGSRDGAAVLASLRKAVRYTYTEILRYRSDLSYVPAPSK